MKCASVNLGVCWFIQKHFPMSLACSSQHTDTRSEWTPPSPPGQPPLRLPGQERLLWSDLVPPGLHGVCRVRSGRGNARLEGGRRVPSDSSLLGPNSRSGVVVVVIDSLLALSCGSYWQIQMSEEQINKCCQCWFNLLTWWNPNEICSVSAADGRSGGAAAFNHLVVSVMFTPPEFQSQYFRFYELTRNNFNELCSLAVYWVWNHLVSVSVLVTCPERLPASHPGSSSPWWHLT